MNVRAIYPVLMTDRVEESRRFYAELLDLDLAFDSDWYVQLISAGTDKAQMGMVESGHESIPAAFRDPAEAGFLVTVEVEDVDSVFERAVLQETPIELSLRDEEWGQRHFITRDPNGIAVDVVKVIPVTSSQAASHYTSPPA